MKKVDGVTDVHVSLEAAFTQVDLRPGNTVTLEHLRTIIRRSGFRTADAQITASGILRDDKGQLIVDLTPAKTVLTLAAGDGAAMKDARGLASGGVRMGVQVEGVVHKDSILTLHRISREKRPTPAAAPQSDRRR